MNVVGIFRGFYSPGTTLVYFLAILVIKFVLLVVLGPAAMIPNLMLAFLIGFGLVASTFEYPESSLMLRILCWIAAFSQIGLFATMRI